MKKLLSLILAVGLTFGICFVGLTGYNVVHAEEKEYGGTDDWDYSSSEHDPYTERAYDFHILPQIILNQETGCYDIDIYIGSSNKYFSNFEANLKFYYYDGDEKVFPSAKITFKQYVKGNFTANMKNGVLSMVFNATQNVELSEDRITYEDFSLKAFTIKTDIEHSSAPVDLSKDIGKGFYFYDGTIKSAGVMSSDRQVIPFEYCEVSDEGWVILGDYDLDGSVTINDLIAAQYYLVNPATFIDPVLDSMLDSNALQYLQMYLCEFIPYVEYSMYIAQMTDQARLPYDRCDRYWDYEYWADKTYATDSEGYSYLGEDRYGNYHVWNDTLGYKFFIEPKGSNLYGTLWCYEIDETDKMVLPNSGHISMWGDLYWIGDTEREFKLSFNILSGWDENYWSSQTPNPEDDESEGKWNYKGKDALGNKHYWGKNGFKFFTVKMDAYFTVAFRYIVSPTDNKVLILAIEEKAIFGY